MANSTFQSITGPSGPEGIKAVGVTGNSGNTGGTGVTGAEAPFVSRYKWSEIDPSNGEQRIKLTLSDESVVYVGGVSGQNAYVAGVTALGDSVGNPSGEIFKQTTTAGPDPNGATFEFRGLTAAVDLGIEWAENTISISSPIGITTGYVDAGSTGELLFLSPRYKAQGGSGSFYDSFGGPNPTGTGDTINVKFRNAIATVGDEYNTSYCNTETISDGGDGFKEYILDVSNLVRFSPPEENGKRFGYLCISVRFFTQQDRLVVLRTKVDNLEDSETIRKPLYGASEVNFQDPTSGEVLFIDGESGAGEGYGNDSYRRSTDRGPFNTPYENLNEGYEVGVHPQIWSGSTGAPSVNYPSEQAVILDTNCVGDISLEGAVFRGQAWCSDSPYPPDDDRRTGSNNHTYCLRIEEDYFENENTSSPWFGKIRMVVMPGCGSSSGDSTAWEWKIGCDSICSCETGPNGECCNNTTDCDSLASGSISGNVELDVTNSDVFSVSAPINISGITWSYEQRAGISLGSNDGNEFAEMKNITVIVEGGPNNVRFPDNVKFAGTPTFTNGIDIVNLVTIDNGGTWFATQTGYGWDVDIFKEDQLGSCCSNLGCVNFVNKTYCDGVGGSFEESVPCFRRSDPECGAGITGGCCSGLEGTVNTGVLCDDAGGITPPDDYICCSEGPGCLPIGDSDIIDYAGCIIGQCTSCCGGEFKFNYCDDVCVLPLQRCCFAEQGFCTTITDGCNTCEAMNGTTVNSCEECDIGNDLPIKCCAPCPFGCIDVRDEAACTALNGTPSENRLCSGCLGLPQYGDSDIVGRPKCLTPSTLLQCNIINGYFVPSSVTEDVCSICETINVCDPPPVGACCDDTNGDCRGIMIKEICDSIGLQNPELNIKWLGADTECDDCCGNQEFRGACCFCNENCVPNLTPQECSSLRGIFMGIDSTCGAVNCSIAGPCNCTCENTGCCDCPPGHPSRSPCCDDPNSDECCDTGDWCDDDDDDDDPDDNDGIDDTEGFEIPSFPMGPAGPRGPGTPRSDWIVGACCIGPGKCYQMFVPSRLLGIFGDFSAASYAEERCTSYSGGAFSPWQTCADSECEKIDFVGACCCATWSIVCDDDEEENCGVCEVGDVVIKCSDCSFNGNKPGFGRPINPVGGPSKPLPPDYPPSFEPPTGDKRNTNPGPPYVTPDGTPIRYDAGACCTNKGGCASAPCVLEDRILLADQFGFNGTGSCSQINLGICSEHSTLCNDGDILCPALNELAGVCGICNLGACKCVDGGCFIDGVDRGTINDETGSPEYLENISNNSSCGICSCLPPGPCPDNCGVCEDRVQSQCRFIFDKSQFSSPSTIGTACAPNIRTPNGNNPPRNGGSGTSTGFTPTVPHPNTPPYKPNSSSICEKNARVFGPRLKDGGGAGNGYPSPFYNSNVNRQEVNQSRLENTIDFRQINTKVESKTSTLNGKTVNSFKRR